MGMTAAQAGKNGPAAGRVGIVISNYGGWRDTLACLQSLRAQTCQDFEIILIDDASPNDSVARLRESIAADVIFLPQKTNIGFAAANNIGMRRALADGCEWVLLLNNDTVCAPDMLENLLRSTPPGAVSCPKMLHMDPPDEIWFAGGTLDRRRATVVHYGSHQKDGPAYAQKKQIGFITFCCVLLPRQAIERVGFLDETLFMYCEDVDYCIRLADAGCALWFVPQARLWHRAGGSTGGMMSVYYITRNTLYLTWRGKSAWRRRLAAAGAVAVGGVKCALAALAGHRHGRSYGQWRGALDFARGKMGRMQG